MGTVVKEIFEAVETVIQTELGFTAAANRLRHIIEFEKNDFRTIEDAYGLLRGTAEPVTGVNRSYTMDHGYQLLLTGRVISRSDDQAIQEVLHTLYDRADTVLKALINQKAGLATKVLNIFGQTWPDPEVFDENKLVLLRTGFIIKFREPLN